MSLTYETAYKQVVNPEIVSLREASHALQTLMGAPPGEEGADEDEDASDPPPGTSLPVLFGSGNSKLNRVDLSPGISFVAGIAN